MARSFSGSEHIQIVSINTQVNSPLSGACWAQASVGIGTFPLLCGQNSAGNLLWGINLGTSAGLNLWYSGGANQTNNASAFTTASTGVWHHCAFTVVGGGGAMAVYVDGISVGTAAASGGQALTTLDIGNNNAGNSNWKGFIADFALWTIALSQVEISALALGVLRPHQIRPQELAV